MPMVGAAPTVGGGGASVTGIADGDTGGVSVGAGTAARPVRPAKPPAAPAGTISKGVVSARVYTGLLRKKLSSPAGL